MKTRKLYQRFLDRAQCDLSHRPRSGMDRQPSATVRRRYPETYLIDREGMVIRKYVGAENWQRPEILNYLQSLL